MRAFRFHHHPVIALFRQRSDSAGYVDANAEKIDVIFNFRIGGVRDIRDVDFIFAFFQKCDLIHDFPICRGIAHDFQRFALQRLDPKRTSPYKFYQYWINATDADVASFIRIFTLKSIEEIEAIEKEHEEAPHLRILQKVLAEDITTSVHGREEMDSAIRASEILFGKSVADDLKTLKEDALLSVLDGVPQVTVTKAELSNVENVTDLLSISTRGEIFSSKGEARKMIQGGGVSINKQKLESFDQSVNFELLHDKYLLVQKGKKNYYLVNIVD